MDETGMMPGMEAGAMLSLQQHQSEKQEDGKEGGLLGISGLFKKFLTFGVLDAHESMFSQIDGAFQHAAQAHLLEQLTQSVSNLLFGGESKNLLGVELFGDVSTMTQGHGPDSGESLTELASASLSQEDGGEMMGSEASYEEPEPLSMEGPGELPHFDASLQNAMGDSMGDFANEAALSHDNSIESIAGQMQRGHEEGMQME